MELRSNGKKVIVVDLYHNEERLKYDHEIEPSREWNELARKFVAVKQKRNVEGFNDAQLAVYSLETGYPVGIKDRSYMTALRALKNAREK